MSSLTLLAGLLMSATFDDTVKLFEEQTYTYTGGEYKDEAFKWRLLKPLQVEAGKKYPVILFLHGAGERGSDNKNQLKYFGQTITTNDNRQKFPCFVIAPQCRNNQKWSAANWSDTSSAPLGEATDQAKVALGILDEVLKKYPCDDKRIYLTGLSMGGYGTWEIAARYPEKFACAVPICGGGDEAQATKLAKLPIWCFHGGADNVVPTVRSRKMVDAIKAASGNIKYTEFPGVGHNSWDPAYNGTKESPAVIPWMFEQVKP